MLYDGYEAIIGLECHAQLRTRSKMFCACPLPPEGAPENSYICPICMGHPGTLPMLNAEAVALGIRAGLALGATIHTTSVFARKNYFYPDLPKGYQISQYDRPLITGGRIHTSQGDFGITRMHLEEDAGKMQHQGTQTVVDWNRAGVPLLEIVSEAEMRTPEQAEAYMRGLHRVLVEGGICGGDLEKGQLRCDVNISVHRPDEPWGVRTEVKNVNSFRFVAKAIRFEIDRQIQALKAGERLYQETRTWNGSRTVLLRRKEGSADYRYFPEPDLLPLVLSTDELRLAREQLAGVPLDLHLAEEDRRRVEAWQAEYGLSAYDVGVIQGEPEAAAFFQATVTAGGAPKGMANWVMTDGMRRWKADGIGKLTPEAVVKLAELVEKGTLNRDGARTVVDRLVDEGGDPIQWAEKLGLQQLSDEGQLRSVAMELIQKFPGEYQKYKGGNKGLMGFFVGELMRATGRKADPKVAQRLVREVLEG